MSDSTVFTRARTRLLDEGQFGQALILSSFNYKRGRIYGGEFTTNYDHGPFSLYGNAAWEWARGEHVSSAQFLFDPDEYAFINNHWVFLDHDQRWTATAGGAYTWQDWRLSSEFLYGSGLRRGFANTKSVPDYGTVNLGASADRKNSEMAWQFQNPFRYRESLRQDLRTARRQRHRRRRAAIRTAPRILRDGRLRFLSGFVSNHAILDRHAPGRSFAVSAFARFRKRFHQRRTPNTHRHCHHRRDDGRRDHGRAGFRIRWRCSPTAGT